MEKPNSFVAQIENGFRFGHELATIEDLLAKPIHIKHAHPTYEIYYLESGNVTYTVAGKVYKVNPGDVVIMNAYVLHSVDIEPTADYHRYVLEFKIDSIPVLNGINPIARFFNTSEFINVIPKELVEKSKILDILKKMESEYDSEDEYCNHILTSNITLCVVEIAKLIDLEQNLGYKYIKHSDKNSEIVNRVIQYINSNIKEDLSVVEIAQEVGFSKSYLQHIFKEVVGTPISQYILIQKMQTANFLLQNGKSLKQVSDELGYKYYPTFHATYKKFFGYSPKSQKKK